MGGWVGVAGGCKQRALLPPLRHPLLPPLCPPPPRTHVRVCEHLHSLKLPPWAAAVHRGSVAAHRGKHVPPLAAAAAPLPAAAAAPLTPAAAPPALPVAAPAAAAGKVVERHSVDGGAVPLLHPGGVPLQRRRRLAQGGCRCTRGVLCAPPCALDARTAHSLTQPTHAPTHSTHPPACPPTSRSRGRSSSGRGASPPPLPAAPARAHAAAANRR